MSKICEQCGMYLSLYDLVFGKLCLCDETCLRHYLYRYGIQPCMATEGGLQLIIDHSPEFADQARTRLNTLQKRKAEGRIEELRKMFDAWQSVLPFDLTFPQFCELSKDERKKLQRVIQRENLRQKRERKGL